MMGEPGADVEHHFTVLVRLPFNRGDFIDPPPVAWSAAKERDLWQIISQPSKGNDIDWNSLAERFQVSPQFLLQQAAWLYERQLSQVRTQIRRMGTNQSNLPSPAPISMGGSTLGPQTPRRTNSGSSRVPSGLSNRQRESPIPTSEGENIRSTKTRSSGLTRKPSTNAGSDLRGGSAIRQSPRLAERELLSYPTSHQPPQSSNVGEDRTSAPSSPIGQDSSSEGSSSDDDDKSNEYGAVGSRRHQSHLRRRRGTQPRSDSFRPAQSAVGDEADEDDDGSDSSPFLPFAAAAALPKSHSSTSHTQDPGATLRDDLRGISRPNPIRRTTSERVPSSPTTPITQRFSNEVHSSPDPDQRLSTQRQPLSTIESSLAASSDSSSTNNNNNSAPTSNSRPAPQPAIPSSQQQDLQHLNRPTTSSRTPSTSSPLSPRQAAALGAAGVLPRVHRRNGGNNAAATGQTSDSTGTPSMGSSFSDLDDTSVTQSALEEALLSNMQSQGTNGNGNGNGNGGQGVASRMSTISQALRSRYL